MPQLKLKTQNSEVHIPGLGVFKPGQFTQVTDEQVAQYESQTRSVITREEFTNRAGEPEVKVTTEVVNLKVDDLFEVKPDPVEKKDTAAKKADNGGDDK